MVCPQPEGLLRKGLHPQTGLVSISMVEREISREEGG
jgi:hypothetical protein